MAKPERIGEQIWKELHEALNDRVAKAFFILPEGYTLVRKAIESFDLGVYEGAVLLCSKPRLRAHFSYSSAYFH